MNISGGRAVEPDVEKFEGVGQAELDEDDAGNDWAVEDADGHDGEVADDVDERLVGVVGQLGGAVPRVIDDAANGDARESNQERQEEVGHEVEDGQNDQLEAELVLPADESDR